MPRGTARRGLDDEEAEDDGVLKDLGVDGALDYEATYGPAFSISPASAAKTCATSVLLGRDDDLKAWVADAAKHASYIVGVVI